MTEVAGTGRRRQQLLDEYVQKNFGDKYNIKMTFVPVTRKEDVTVFNELLAAGEEPDILFSYDYPTMISYYSRGAFQPIDEDVLKTTHRHSMKRQRI